MGVVGATWRMLLCELLALLIALLAGVCLGGLLAVFKPLATFGSESLALAVYAPLALACGMLARDAVAAPPQQPPPASSIAYVTASSRPCDSGAISRQIGAASLAPWLLLLVPFEAMRLGTAYLGALFCALNGCGLILAHALAAWRGGGGGASHGESPCGEPPRRAAAATQRLATAAQLLAALIPTLHMNGICGWLLQVLIPITARTGVVVPTDVAVGAVVALVTALASTNRFQPVTISSEHQCHLQLSEGHTFDSRLSQPSGCVLAPVHASKQTRPLTAALLLASCLALALALLRSPFTAETPKRLLVSHVGRECVRPALDPSPLGCPLLQLLPLH